MKNWLIANISYLWSLLSMSLFAAVDVGYAPATYGADGTQVLVGFVRKPTISSLGATRTLTASESGSIIVLDRAAGIVITLPAPIIGMQFEFHVSVSVTSNAYKIITSAGTVLLTGSLVSIDSDSTNAVAAWTANGSTHIAINMTAAGSNALGGLQGTVVRLTCINSLLWLVEGVDIAGGTVATPFATS